LATIDLLPTHLSSANRLSISHPSLYYLPISRLATHLYFCHPSFETISTIKFIRRRGSAGFPFQAAINVGAVSVLAGGGGTLLGGIIVKKLGNALQLSFYYSKYYYP